MDQIIKELRDYVGEFNPNLRFEDFSKDAFVGLWEATSGLYPGLYWAWFGLIKEGFGEEMAIVSGNLAAED